MELQDRRIVLGITGGIAAYKAIEVCRRLVSEGAHVIPVLTNAAHNMIGPTTLSALASEPVKTSMFSDSNPIPHTRLGQDSDLILVCPATARIISDYRTGRSADLLSATLIATVAPVVICPAMHTEMWEHPAVQENLAVLADRGTIIVGPEQGRLAGGDVGTGRLASPETIVEAVIATLKGRPTTGNRPLSGRRVVISAGGTREAIDPVRFIGNRSSGKQGHALAAAAAELGADVTLVTTSDLPTPAGVRRRVDVESAAEMHTVMMAESNDADVIIMSAAVADFRPVSVAERKLKKTDGVPGVELEPTVDILAALGERKPPAQVLVGFAAETDDLEANAADKLKRKGADLLVANDVSAPGVGFAHDTNAVTIFGSDGSALVVPLSSKDAIARAVLTAVIDRLPSESKNP
ncbi:MAG: bifunctional phosphopantothenoylcysteine decarboxylase/phosphopantothenate--cysteine ligase CoaBC [Acidimicrobiia bacterium]|nr:bifunctional phosphopantothenoylcysteine decarboxylase/phosphopantothenate--cysteine ligase CoaBC [Acidimicrobiia bacterium]